MWGRGGGEGWCYEGLDALAGSARAKEDDLREVVVHAAEFLVFARRVRAAVLVWELHRLGKGLGGRLTYLVYVRRARSVGAAPSPRHDVQVPGGELVVFEVVDLM